MIPSGGMFRERAELYDLIYHWKDYASEAERLRALLAEGGVPEGSRIIEAACGTGGHLVHLAQHYALTGFDLSPDMIAIAKRKVPNVPLFVADMCDFEVDGPFDAALCLFSSLGYLRSEEELVKTARAFARALRPGGLLVIEPWLTEAAYRAGRAAMHTYDREDLKICRSIVSKQEGDVAVLDFHWLVARNGAGDVEHFVEQHRLWLCPWEKLLATFGAAGFEAEIRPDGLMKDRGLLVGRRS
jgi:SAM-dependent methyltransferase